MAHLSGGLEVPLGDHGAHFGLLVRRPQDLAQVGLRDEAAVVAVQAVERLEQLLLLDQPFGLHLT